MPAERSFKFKLDLRAQDARALLALIEAHGYDARDTDRTRFERIRARLHEGIAWLAKRYGVPVQELLATPDTDEEVRDASAS